MNSSSGIELDWRTIAATDLGNYPNLVSDLLARRIDGVVVTGVFSPEDAAEAVSKMPSDMWDASFIGGSTGMPLGALGDADAERVAYLDDTARCSDIYEQVFGAHPHHQIAQVLSPAASGRPLLPASEGGRPYLAGQLRYWEPGLAGLRAHVGNEFGRAHSHQGMKHLVTTTNVVDHLSYFVVLQAPDEGGDLAVYDLLWEEDDASNDARVDMRDDSRFDDLACLSVRPNAGDLVLFGGGWRWHRVNPVTGQRARITYGGFCAPSIDGREIHFWA